MDRCFLFILCLNTVASHIDYLSDDFSDELHFFTTNADNDDADQKPLAKYEVTEIIQELPNTETLGSVFTNYTINRPLNLATTKPVNTTKENNYSSLIHENIEYDKENTIEEIPHVSSIKGYINGLLKGFVSGFNSILNKFKRRNVSEERPYFTGPVVFINKLRHSDDFRGKYNSRYHDDD